MTQEQTPVTSPAREIPAEQSIPVLLCFGEIQSERAVFNNRDRETLYA